jgi:hypothetical protein
MLNDKIQAQLRLLLACSGRKSRHRVHRQTAITQCPDFGNVIVERGCLNVCLYLICQSCINLRLLSGNDEASKAAPQESNSLSVAVTGKIAFRQDRDVMQVVPHLQTAALILNQDLGIGSVNRKQKCLAALRGLFLNARLQ